MPSRASWTSQRKSSRMWGLFFLAVAHGFVVGLMHLVAGMYLPYVKVYG